jgi:hypothetical protein
MAKVQISKIRVRRGQELQTGIPQLDAGEFGWAEDTEHLYIGKRIAEGAVDDNNSRILTENDLNNIFSLIGGGGAIASTSSYQYREGVPYIHSTASTIAIKLDNWVSLTDYGVVETSIDADITLELRRAIEDLYYQGLSTGYDTFEREDARRKLIIPAGNYIVSEQIPIPPYTSLVGEGPGLTTITFAPSGEQTALFTTVDADGNNFVVGSGDLPFNPAINNNQGAREIHIEGMTLQYRTGNGINWPLLSLQEVSDVNVRNVHFTTKNLSGFTTHGVAIEIRSSIVTDLEDAPAGNISIENCKFENLNAAIVQNTGTVNRFFFNNNVFDNLQSGITMWSDDVNVPGISNGVIDSNRFEYVVGSAIVIGTSTYSAFSGNTVSSNNTFRNVGNGTGQTDYTVVQGYPGASPVIKFNSYGNVSINDKFSRKDAAKTTPNNSIFYYTPLVLGRAEIKDDATVNTTIAASGNTDIIKIPTTGYDQNLRIEYSMVDISGTQYSRKGRLIVNIVGTDTTGSSISDYYNYSIAGDYTDPTFYIDSSYIIGGFIVLICTNSTGLLLNFEYQTNLMLS